MEAWCAAVRRQAGVSRCWAGHKGVPMGMFSSLVLLLSQRKAGGCPHVERLLFSRQAAAVPKVSWHVAETLGGGVSPAFLPVLQACGCFYGG